MEATAGNALQDAALRGSIAQLERDLEEARREMRLSQANATRVQADAARYKTLVETVTADKADAVGAKRGSLQNDITV